MTVACEPVRGVGLTHFPCPTVPSCLSVDVVRAERPGIQGKGGCPDRLPGRGERVALTARQTPAAGHYLGPVSLSLFLVAL
jgi:hypothetical protein